MASSKVDVKTVMLGAAGAGKTTLVERYLNKRFVENPQATIGAAFNAKKITIDGETITLGLWDTAGTDRYESMSRIYYRGAKAALVCFDLKSNESFEKVKFWIEELKQAEPTCLLFIVGTQSDTLIDGEARVDDALVRNFAAKVDAAVFVTSAKTGKGVDDLFFAVGEAYLRQRGRATVDGSNKDDGKVDVRGGNNGSNGSTCPC
mmetsp:Transcript_8474/g.14639  ORF Transcript_8474/g.14639 Transcript_8474/m.14639 type:complete len:205 (+) Transcript_8474:146-760(+)